MVEAKTKKVTSRSRRKAANSPIPSGPMSEMGGGTCGHSGCSTGTCKVRFVGPTSSMRDHHIMHAARGASQVWTAAIVAGLAVVLTGAIGYTAVQAQTDDAANAGNANVQQQLVQINKRLSNIEEILRARKQQGEDDGAMASTTRALPHAQALNVSPKACIELCAKTTATCAKAAGDDTDARKVCIDQDATCRKACAPAK